jgi:hypothetical protein
MDKPDPRGAILTCKTLPSFSATKTKTKDKIPKMRERILDILVALASSMFLKQYGRTKSSKVIAANELTPEETVLQKIPSSK